MKNKKKGRIPNDAERIRGGGGGGGNKKQKGINKNAKR
jgi:hypothetical protein